MFSRSQHLRQVGLEEACGRSEEENGHGPLQEGGDITHGDKHLETDVQPDGTEPSGQPEWHWFKDKFSQALENCEVEMSREGGGEGEGEEGRRHQLLVETIIAMHRASPERGEHNHGDVSDSNGLLNEAGGHREKETFARLLSAEAVSQTSEQQTLGKPSPRIKQKPLLSVGTLETIREAEIDWLLETVDTADGRGMRESEPSSAPPDVPRLVWAEEGEGSLMGQLERLSQRQSSGGVVTGKETDDVFVASADSDMPLTQTVEGVVTGRETDDVFEASTSPSQPAPGETDGTAPVFLDLRPLEVEPNEPTAVSSSVQRLLALRGSRGR